MPGTGTPEPGGLLPREAFPIVRRLCAESNVVGFELVELEAITYADMDDEAALGTAIDRILEIDPEVNTRDEADRWMTLLLSDLEEMRKG